MRSALSLLILLGLFPACGGGAGGAADSSPDLEVFELVGDTLTHQPRTVTYQVSGTIEPAQREPIPISGTRVTRQGQPETVGGFLCAALEQEEQYGSLAATHTESFSRRDEVNNVALETGRRLADGSTIIWHSPISLGPLRYAPGQAGGSDDALLGYSQELSAPRLRLEAYSWSVDRRGIITVPAGTFECYVVYRTERMHDLLTGQTDVSSSITYVRPDFGVIQSTVRINRELGGEWSEHVLLYEAVSIH